MMPYMDRVAGYIRVSTEKQAEDDSHIRQRETVENYVESNFPEDVEIDWYADIAESGQDLSRPEYESLMDKLHRYDAVIVREMSRFGRDAAQIWEDLEILQDNDVDFISVKNDGIDTTTAQGEMLFKIVSVINEFKANLARERTLELIEQKKNSGEGWGRDRKLTDKQIRTLYNLYNENDGVSYNTLKLIAVEEREWVDDISRHTIRNYIKAVENGEIEA